MTENFQIQYLDPFKEWKDLDGEIYETRDAAFNSLMKWERSCHHDNFRWIKKTLE